MSWISDLAGKAENFLNNLDSSAAQALNKSQDNLDKKLQYNRKTEPTVIKEYDRFSQRSTDNFGADSIRSLPLNKSTNKISDKTPEENIFKFNYNSKIPRSGSEIFTSTNYPDTLSDNCSSGYRTVNDYDYVDKSDQSINMNIDSNPSIENKLLRSEISSLNQEISSLLQRNHKSEEDNKRIRNQLEKVSHQLRDCDKKYRELISEKDDINETMKVKEQKISVLQSEIQLISSRKSDSGGSTADTNLISDHRNKIILLDRELKLKTELLEKLEGEKLNWQSSLDDAKIKLAQTINNYEKSRVDDKRRIDILTEQMNISNQKRVAIQNDLKEYKVKAANILQMKEKIIASLKGANDGTEDKYSFGSYSDDLQQELSNMRHECDLLREEIARCRVEMEHRDFDLQELDHQMHNETESLRKNIDLLEEQLEREKQLREDVDTDYRQLTRENRHLQEKYMREKADFHDHLSAKDEEINRMRQMISTKQTNQTDQVMELEARVRSLTDTLIQKQAVLDSNKADYHSLQIRLERTEIELSLMQKPNITSGMSTDRRGNIGLGNTEFIAINMQDTPVTKNLKTAVNNLDKISLKIGIFLRRYPPARLFFIIYTVILHFWMLFVFLTYQPEIHSSNLNIPNAPNVPKGN